jgi:predicted RNase H-like HicB family nuclease
MINESHAGELEAGESRTVVVRVHVEHEDPEGYWAEVVELPGCFASGLTAQALNESLRVAIERYLSTAERPVEVTCVGPAARLPRQRSSGRHARPDEHLECRSVEFTARESAGIRD